MSCIECDGLTERSVYPYWGRAPGGDRVLVIEGRIAFAQGAPDAPETWPASFREDPEMPGFGTYQCPKCYGREESEMMEKRLSISDLLKAAGAPEGSKVVSLTWACEPEGTMDLNESGDPDAALYVAWRPKEKVQEESAFIRAVQGLMKEHDVSRFNAKFIDADGTFEGVTVYSWGSSADDDDGAPVEPFDSYTVVITAEGPGFSAYLKELPGVITQGATVDEVLTRIREAFNAWFDSTDLALHTKFVPELTERSEP